MAGSELGEGQLAGPPAVPAGDLVSAAQASARGTVAGSVRRGMADVVAGGVGVGGAGAAVWSAAAGGPWWVVALSGLVSVVSGVLAVAGRTAAMWHWVRRLGLMRRHEDRIVGHVEWLTTQLENPGLPAEKRAAYQGELDKMHQMLIDLRRY